MVSWLNCWLKLFGLFDVVADVLYLAGGVLEWSFPTAVTTVIGGVGNVCLWKKDGKVSVEGIVTPFCFPSFGME